MNHLKKYLQQYFLHRLVNHVAYINVYRKGYVHICIVKFVVSFVRELRMKASCAFASGHTNHLSSGICLSAIRLDKQTKPIQND